jgi:hypothetical protein
MSSWKYYAPHQYHNCKGGTNPTFFRPMHWVLGLNAIKRKKKKRNPISVNKTMALSQHSTLGNQHHQ